MAPTLALQRPPVSLGKILDIATGLALAPAALGDRLDRSSPVRLSTRLLVTETYEAWLLLWPPGSGIDPHDHGDSHGAFVVVDGELGEIRWGRTRTRQRTLGAGQAATVPLGAVHGVETVGARPALSVHVYSPPLSEMRFYDDAGRDVVAVEPVGPGG